MAIGGVVLNWAANTARSVRDVDKLTRALKDQDKNASRLGGTLKTALKAGVAGIGVAAVGAGFALMDMAKAAYADQQATAKLDRTLRRIPGVTRKSAAATADWIDKMELATNIADDDLRKALGRLAVATGDVGKAQELAALAADAAIGSNQEFATVAKAMEKATAGNTQALKRMFPWLEAGPDKVLTLAEAMDQLRKKYGGAAEAAADQDVFARLATVWGQLKEALGSAFLPVLNELADWFKDDKNKAKIQEWIGKVQEWATTVGEDLLGKLQEFVDYLKSPAGKQAITDFTETVKALAGAVETLAGWLGKAKDLWEWYTGKGGPMGGYAEDPRNFFTPEGGGLRGVPYGTNRGEGPGKNRALASYGGGGSVTVINNYPKPEPASSNTARSLRQARLYA